MKICKRSHILSSLIFLWSSSLFSIDNGKKNPKDLDTFIEIEAMASSADEFHLPSLEKKIVRMLQISPKSPYVHFLLSEINLRYFIMNPDDFRFIHTAIELAEQAIQLDPHSEFGYLASANISSFLGKTKEAQSALQKTKDLSSKSWRYELMEAKIKLSEDQDAEEYVLDQIRALIRKNPDPDFISIAATTVLSIIEEKDLEPELELKNIHEWNKVSPHVIFKQAMADLYNKLGKVKQAHVLYLDLYKDNQEQRRAKINDAVILYRHFKKFKNAIAILKESSDYIKNRNSDIMPFDSNPITKEDLTFIKLHLGLAYLQTKDETKAFQELIESVKTSLDPMDTVVFLENEFYKLKKHDLFTEFMLQVNLEVPGQDHFYALLGDHYFKKSSDYKKSLQAYSQAITLNPYQSEYYGAAGLALYKLKTYDQAVLFFDHAILMNPEDSISYYNKACVLNVQGLIPAALKNLRKAITLSPNLKNLAAEDDDFTSIRERADFQFIIQKGTFDQFQKL
ncbi:MAG: hypothetical protein KA436_03910 [Oligoflexales bacterium]|nr:hypothetical protein [Oligoflexales bacterium]